MNLKKYWHDPVGSKLISAAIIALAGTVTGFAVYWWSALQCAIAATWGYLLTASPIPHWILGVLIAMSALFVLLLVGVAGILLTAKNQNQNRLESFSLVPDYHSHRTDNFLGLKWRWNYQDGEIHLTTFCTHCDFQVFPNDNSAMASGFIATVAAGISLSRGNRGLPFKAWSSASSSKNCEPGHTPRQVIREGRRQTRTGYGWNL